jgi:hypothetical protein
VGVFPGVGVVIYFKAVLGLLPREAFFIDGQSKVCKAAAHHGPPQLTTLLRSRG